MDGQVLPLPRTCAQTPQPRLNGRMAATTSGAGPPNTYDTATAAAAAAGSSGAARAAHHRNALVPPSRHYNGHLHGPQEAAAFVGGADAVAERIDPANPAGLAAPRQLASEADGHDSARFDTQARTAGHSFCSLYSSSSQVQETAGTGSAVPRRRQPSSPAVQPLGARPPTRPLHPLSDRSGAWPELQRPADVSSAALLLLARSGVEADGDDGLWGAAAAWPAAGWQASGQTAGLNADNADGLHTATHRGRALKPAELGGSRALHAHAAADGRCIRQHRPLRRQLQLGRPSGRQPHEWRPPLRSRRRSAGCCRRFRSRASASAPLP